MQIRQIVLNSRDYVGEGAYKLWKLDPNSQVLANVVFFGTLNDWNNNKFYQLFDPRILGAEASLEFVTGFLRPSSSKGHFGDWWNFSRIIWKHLHWTLMFSQINCIKKSQITSWLIFYFPKLIYIVSTNIFTVKSMECEHLKVLIFEGKHNGLSDRVRSAHVPNGTSILTPHVTSHWQPNWPSYQLAHISKGTKYIIVINASV